MYRNRNRNVYAFTTLQLKLHGLPEARDRRRLCVFPVDSRLWQLVSCVSKVIKKKTGKLWQSQNYNNFIGLSSLFFLPLTCDFFSRLIGVVVCTILWVSVCEFPIPKLTAWRENEGICHGIWYYQFILFGYLFLMQILTLLAPCSALIFIDSSTYV